MGQNVLGTPVAPKSRIVILDALRGFALLGIVMANFPEFALWTFLEPSAQAAMPSANIDRMAQWALYIFVDGKFYTIFSILFGIGFTIILRHAAARGGDGLRIFVRRMLILTLIGCIHLLFIWSGDILMLYALVGILLLCFRRVPPARLLYWALAFLLLPVAVTLWRSISGLDPSQWLYEQWWNVARANGIDESNFAIWLHDAHDYGAISAFLKQGAVERMWEFVSGSRYFKVMGLFLIGCYIG